jgi:toxin HigB-1
MLLLLLAIGGQFKKNIFEEGELDENLVCRNFRQTIQPGAIQDLIEIRGNRFEKLSGDRKGQFSIRINDQYRICFKWEKENAIDVEIIDYHK